MPDSTWRETAVLWLNYPNNPTAATASLEMLEHAAALAREHDFVVASDEAYSELYFGSTPPVSALQLPDLRNVAVFNTLSKRSSMPGYRSGFVAGDPELITAAQALPAERRASRRRPSSSARRSRRGATRRTSRPCAATYRAKRDVLLPVLEDHGLRSAGGDATFFLWLDAGPQADLLAARLLEAGIVLAPGSFFGDAGRGYLRLALVPTLAECERAAERLDARSLSYCEECSASLRPPQRPLRGSASTAPVCELRRNSSPLAPVRSPALTTLPSGSATRVPAVT